jgi:NADH:ubiquinone oxidoreductase subunit E
MMTLLQAPPVFSSAVAPEVAARVRAALAARALAGAVAPPDVDAVAAELAIPLAHAYIALGLDPTLILVPTTEVALAICVGGCQLQGALPLLEGLLVERSARLATGRPSFDVQPRGCLDLCPGAPAMLSRSAVGVMRHVRMTREQVPPLLAELLDD